MINDNNIQLNYSYIYNCFFQAKQKKYVYFLFVFLCSSVWKFYLYILCVTISENLSFFHTHIFFFNFVSYDKKKKKVGVILLPKILINNQCQNRNFINLQLENAVVFSGWFTLCRTFWLKTYRAFGLRSCLGNLWCLFCIGNSWNPLSLGSFQDHYKNLKEPVIQNWI